MTKDTLNPIALSRSAMTYTISCDIIRAALSHLGKFKNADPAEASFIITDAMTAALRRKANEGKKS
jgi:hypothetical protein